MDFLVACSQFELRRTALTRGNEDKVNEVSYNRFIDAFIKAQGQDAA